MKRRISLPVQVLVTVGLDVVSGLIRTNHIAGDTERL